ncbi:MAG: hypothetical protein WCO84_07285 [bacterium]
MRSQQIATRWPAGYFTNAKTNGDEMKQTPNAKGTQCELNIGQECEGFRIEQVTPLPELRATAICARHGACRGSDAGSGSAG